MKKHHDTSSPTVVSFARCSRHKSSNRNAASPRGDLVYPLAISPTVEYATPIASAIWMRDKPDDSNERTFSDQEVQALLITGVYGFPLRCQLDSVTSSTCNGDMKEKPKNLATFGARVREWRIYRGLSRSGLASALGIPVSTLSDIENEQRSSSKYLTQIAKSLELNPQYLATGKGDAENIVEFPLDVDATRLSNLSALERKYISLQLKILLDEVESNRAEDSRRKSK